MTTADRCAICGSTDPAHLDFVRGRWPTDHVSVVFPNPPAYLPPVPNGRIEFTPEERVDAIRERYQTENAGLRVYIGQLRTALRLALDAYGTTDGRLALRDALALDIPDPWRPDTPSQP